MDEKLLEKKRHLDRADQIVNQLSNETVDDKAIISLIKLIEPYHYEEVVEERFVSKICGYPLCGTALAKIPDQKFKISAKLNQVYELSDRKRYCSSDCFKASKFLEAQISKTPVWMRQTDDYLKNEANIPIKLWSKTSIKVEPESVKVEQVKESLDLGDIARELNQVENDWKDKYQQSSQTSSQESRIDEERMRQRSEQLRQRFQESISIHKRPVDVTILKKVFTFTFDDQTTSGYGGWIFPMKSRDSLNQLFFIEYIVSRIDNLLSTRTRQYLRDDEDKSKSTVSEERESEEYDASLDQIVVQKGLVFSDVTNQSSVSSHVSFVPKHDQDLDDGEAEMLAKLKGFEDVIQASTSGVKPTESKIQPVAIDETWETSNEAKKPLPDYNKLREEAIAQQLKIKEFFQTKQVKVKAEEKNNGLTIISGDGVDENSTEFRQNMIFKVKETNEEIVRVLPPVDSKSQSQIRRNIFYEQLIKSTEILFKFSEFIYADLPISLKSHVKNFIFSLNLTNENVLFSSSEWPIVALFVVKLLSMRESVKSGAAFEELIKADRLVDTMLASFHLDQSKLTAICSYLIHNH